MTPPSAVASPQHLPGRERSGYRYIPIAKARALLGPPCAPLARATVLSMGIRREVDVREVAGRFVCTSASVRAYRNRHGLATEAAR